MSTSECKQCIIRYVLGYKGKPGAVAQVWRNASDITKEETFPVPFCRGSSTGGVLLWVLAILTMNGTGEAHQQEEKRRN